MPSTGDQGNTIYDFLSSGEDSFEERFDDGNYYYKYY